MTNRSSRKSPKVNPKCPVQIGYETIHKEQLTATEHVMRVLRERRRVPLVVAQFQSGKTGVMIAVAKAFIESCLARKKKYQVIVTCGLSDLKLIEQTFKRFHVGTDDDDGDTFVGAKLTHFAVDTELSRYPGELDGKGVVVLNYTALNKYDWNKKPVDERLVIIDEAHAALVKNGNIDSFLRTLGVNLSEQVHTWDSSKTVTHVVPVSATPFPQSILSNAFSGGELSGAALFEVIYMSPGPRYLSVAMMRDQGRFHQVRPLFHDDGSPTEFLLEVLAEFKKLCRIHGPGYLVIRATGIRHEDLVKYTNSRGDIEIKCFDQSGDLDSEEIKKLNDYLSNEPKIPELILIRGAMRAGITLKENFIRGWVETRSKQCDTQTQAGIGRACGYNRTETYPIYTQLKAVEDVIQYFEDCEKGYFTAMPSGTQCRAVLPKHLPSPSGKKTMRVILMTKDQADDLKAKLTAAAGYTHNSKGKKSVYQITSTSGQNVMFKAGLVLNGQFDPSRRDDGTNVTMGYYLNGPGTHKTSKGDRQQKQDYRDLMQIHPTWHKRVVVPAEMVKDHPEWVKGYARDVLEIRSRTQGKKPLSYLKPRALFQKDAPVKKGNAKG